MAEVTNTNEALLKEVVDLKAAVLAAGADRSTLDVDRMVKGFTAALKENDDARAKAAAEPKVARRGELIGPAGFEERSPGIVEGGKFDGKSVADLQFINWMLNEGRRKGAGMKAPSSELTGVINKALTATGSAAGDEYVPTALSASLWNDFFLSARVGSQFSTIAMPTDPFDIPLGLGDLTWRKGTQNTASTSSTPVTAKSTMTSTEQVAEVNLSYDLDEDSAVAVLPALRALIGRQGGEQIDNFIMNACSTATATGNINLDDSTPSGDAYYMSNGQNGLRHLMIVDNTAQGADVNTTLTDALLRTAIGRLGKYATDPNRLVMFTNPKTYVLSMLGLTNVVTMDKFGSAATVITGQLANYGGIPVVPTSSIALQEDDGKTSTVAASNDEGTILIAHRDMWQIGFRRKLLMEMYQDIQKRQIVLVASFRISVAAQGTRSTAAHTGGAFGITY